jgi:hypothetical protein
MDLLTTSAELARASKATAQRLDIPFTRSFWPRLMMRAFAIECLIKARFLLRAGNTLFKDGKFIGIRNDKSHDLAKLARKADIAITDAEANLLDRLTAVSTGWGKT